MATNIGQDGTTTIRDDVDFTEKMLLEAHGVVNDLIGLIPSTADSSNKEPGGSVDQLALKCQNNRASVANLLDRLIALRSKI